MEALVCPLALTSFPCCFFRTKLQPDGGLWNSSDTNSRYRRCAPTTQIKAMKQHFNVAENVPGFAKLSPESQAEVQAAFEASRVTDVEYTDVRPDLATSSIPGEIRNVVDYKVELALSGRAGCRHSTCPDKIKKGELRLGFLVEFQGEHCSWMFKHW